MSRAALRAGCRRPILPRMASTAHNVAGSREAAPAAGWWALANTVDRLYFGYFVGLGAVVAIMADRVPAWPMFLLVHAVALAIIGLLAATAPGSRLAEFLHDWYPLAAFIICFEEIARLSLVFVPHWQDAYLLRFEAWLFPVPPTEWLARLHSPFATEFLELGYFSYFTLLMIVGGVLYGRADKRPFRQVMTASVLSYFACYVFFLAFPTEGPAHTLGATHVARTGGVFHWLVLLIQNHAGVHGNAFPSSHVAAGVVALIFAWKYTPRVGAWLTPLVALLCVGAVYDGYHYASDVAAGAVVGAVVAGAVLKFSSQQPAISI